MMAIPNRHIQKSLCFSEYAIRMLQLRSSLFSYTSVGKRNIVKHIAKNPIVAIIIVIFEKYE